MEECSTSMEQVGHLLVICVDLNPVWWGKQRTSLSHIIQNICVLVNTHILQNPLNKLVVYGYMSTGVYRLYPDTTNSAEGSSSNGKYEGFDKANSTILAQVQKIMADITDVREHLQLDGGMMSAALLKSLCYINSTLSQLTLGVSLVPRIFFLKGSPDNHSNYMAMMNGIFAAQKAKIAIDVCVIGNDSVFLQQAADITSGTYIRIGDVSELAGYLLGIFLMGVELRKKFNIPPPAKVDFRAGCQCHSKMIDIGYVCSVCMSVYCSFRPICITCNAHFKLPSASLPKGKRTTRKKENGKT